ncbi:hypothetical protein [Candidatus Frankia alpina]|uniref:hypothetical protein n=1 Tax=Candidatus Frankia alpina TaxID=2699483 RepID=UPI0039A0FF01
MATDRAAGQERRLAGRYRLGRVLGSGGGGGVREGEDTLLRRRVAIKEVRRPPVPPRPSGRCSASGCCARPAPPPGCATPAW